MVRGLSDLNFEEVYRKYFADVYRYVLALSRSEHVAEEVTQETFFRALSAIDTFRGECQLRVWLCQIAKNAYYSHMRRQKDKRHILPEIDGGLRVEDAILDRDQAMTVHAHLHELTEPYKEVFMLRVFGELEYAQIAKLFGKTESWARVTYHRAKMKITESMRESEEK